MIYYDKDGIKVRDSEEDDIKYLRYNLRLSDVDEIWASNHVDPNTALREGLKNSSVCLTVLKRSPIAMFGCCPSSLISDRAVIWMLATNDLISIKTPFIRYSRKFVDVMLEQYPLLYNWVDARNTHSVLWLKRIGADVQEAKPFGVENLPFHYFEFTKG